jgi:N6-adenosine-specific RNA methylase IME4
VVDPPWPYKNAQTRNAARKQYEQMSEPEIAALPINRLADREAHLYLWVTAQHLRWGLELVEHWGFQFKTPLVYVKRHLGMGNWWRINHETVLFAVRGGLRPSEIMPWTTFSDKWYGPKPDPTVNVSGPRPRHSEKPDLFYEQVEKASPAPRLDMFARRYRPGWTCWGDGLPRRKIVRVHAIDIDK